MGFALLNLKMFNVFSYTNKGQIYYKIGNPKPKVHNPIILSNKILSRNWSEDECGVVEEAGLVELVLAAVHLDDEGHDEDGEDGARL